MRIFLAQAVRVTGFAPECRCVSRPWKASIAGKELAAANGGKVHIFMIHSKHFNTTKEPYASTVFMHDEGASFASYTANVAPGRAVDSTT
jgi:hypothetical protein